MTEPRVIKVAPGSELDHLLEEAATTPLLLERDGIRYRITTELPEGSVIREPVTDPDEIERIWSETVGCISREEADRMIADIYRWREEGSRPPSRPYEWFEKGSGKAE
jgi:hypothetical protein